MVCDDTHTFGQVYGWVVDQLVGSCQISKNLINCDLIKIIQFCLKIYDLWKHPTHGWVDGWVIVWVWVWGSCQITKISINCNLIELIQFCLKIYDSWRHLYLIPSTQLPIPLGYSQISKDSIALESIKIIQFCLKI